jgi:hypothetical protein
MRQSNSIRRTKLFTVIFFFFTCVNSSCFSHKEVFNHTLSDGTKVTGIRSFNHRKENAYFIVAGKNEKERFHLEYFIQRFGCDTILKKIFENRKVTVLFLTNEAKPDYPISSEDKLVFEFAKPYLTNGNCYSETIGNATGYKVYYKGKVDARLF